MHISYCCLSISSSWKSIGIVIKARKRKRKVSQHNRRGALTGTCHETKSTDSAKSGSHISVLQATFMLLTPLFLHVSSLTFFLFSISSLFNFFYFAIAAAVVVIVATAAAAAAAVVIVATAAAAVVVVVVVVVSVLFLLLLLLHVLSDNCYHSQKRNFYLPGYRRGIVGSRWHTRGGTGRARRRGWG